MECSCNTLDYKETGFFSKLAEDYISSNPLLQPFYEHNVNIAGIKSAIHNRSQFNTSRTLLVSILQEQYNEIALTKIQTNNIKLLADSKTFTITTAHQPNIFTGPLYFVYKIIHAIQLAKQLHKELPEYNFVPVYYMGSEDADLEELGNVIIQGEKHIWKTNQTGAVGRMKVDNALLQLIETIKGQLSVYPFGQDIISKLSSFYTIGTSIEKATFQFVNYLFAEQGLLILLPDNSTVKSAFAPILKKELEEQFSAKVVIETMDTFPTEYKVQATGRDVNLFLLQDGARVRIEKEQIDSTIFQLLQDDPKQFSPNVILRPVLQEFILPNIAFIGGGGEIAYWLELKKVFEASNVPYPVLIIRNSFLILTKDAQRKLKKMGLEESDLFLSTEKIINKIVQLHSNAKLSLENEKAQIDTLYAKMKTLAADIDATLFNHVQSLQKQSIKKIEQLEKKMLKAEKRKFEDEKNQIQKLKNTFFPNGSLQERNESLLFMYAQYGPDFLNMILEKSLGLEQKFTVLVTD